MKCYELGVGEAARSPPLAMAMERQTFHDDPTLRHGDGEPFEFGSDDTDDSPVDGAGADDSGTGDDAALELDDVPERILDRQAERVHFQLYELLWRAYGIFSRHYDHPGCRPGLDNPRYGHR